MGCIRRDGCVEGTLLGGCGKEEQSLFKEKKEIVKRVNRGCGRMRGGSE